MSGVKRQKLRVSNEVFSERWEMWKPSGRSMANSNDLYKFQEEKKRRLQFPGQAEKEGGR
jgi:hypothetical protein